MNTIYWLLLCMKKFFQITWVKVLIVFILAVSLWFSVSETWKPYHKFDSTCIWKATCSDYMDKKSFTDYYQTPKALFAYGWRTSILFPHEIPKLVRVSKDSLLTNGSALFQSIQDLWKHMYTVENSRTFYSTYTRYQYFLLAILWYIIVCIIYYLVAKVTRLFLSLVSIITLATLLLLSFSASYFGDIIRSFWPYLLIGEVATWIILLITSWKYRKTLKNYKFWPLSFRMSLWLPLLLFQTFFVAYFARYFLSTYTQSYSEQLEQSEDSSSMSFFYANVYVNNLQPQKLLDLIKENDPDVAILVEYSQKHKNIMWDYLKKNYPYDHGRIFSKYPLEQIKNGNRFVHVLISKKGTPYHVYAVHTTAPMGKENFDKRNNQLDVLSKDLITNFWKYAKKSSFVIAGDFNVTPWSIYYKNFSQNIDSQLQNISLIKPYLFSRRDARLPYLQTHIDFVRVDNDTQINYFQKISLPGSDHDAFIFSVN